MEICNSATKNHTITCCLEHANAKLQMFGLTDLQNHRFALADLLCQQKCVAMKLIYTWFLGSVYTSALGRLTVYGANTTVGRLKINTTWLVPTPCADCSLCMQALRFFLQQPPLSVSCLFSNTSFLSISTARSPCTAPKGCLTNDSEPPIKWELY